MRCLSLILWPRRFFFAGVLLMLVFISVNVRAQDASTSALRGVVLDSKGATIQGATVTVVNLNTGVRYADTSGVEGAHFLDLLPPGDYSSRGQATGMPLMMDKMAPDCGIPRTEHLLPEFPRNSTTDQRHRLVFSWITEPRPFTRE